MFSSCKMMAHMALPTRTQHYTSTVDAGNRSVVLAFHGHYLRQKPHDVSNRNLGGCSNFFASENNIQSQIIRPLQDAGAKLSVVFYTFTANKSTCSTDDAELVVRLNPVLFKFIEDNTQGPTRRQGRVVDVKIRALQLASHVEHHVDDIVLLRFDVVYNVQLTSLDIVWGKINFAFRTTYKCKGYPWPCIWQKRPGVFDKQHPFLVSDLFHVVPKTHVVVMIEALDWSGNVSDMGAGDHCDDFLLQTYASADMHFIDKSLGNSLRLETGTAGANKTFLAIDRTCPGRACSAAKHRPIYYC